jgi:hypothetical protein
MHLLLTDETNLPTDPAARFFAYGGLFLPVDRLPALDDAVERARTVNGYKPGDELKFETNARPSHVTVEQARLAKEAVMQACLDAGATFVVQVVLNALARHQTQDTLIKWGGNEVLAAFNIWLRAHGSHGIVAVDRLSSTAEYKYLTEKFTVGLALGGQRTMRLERIKLFTSTCINASHASSAMDIVLGAFRYCINAPKNVEAAKKMMAQVVRLLWHERRGDRISAYGLLLRPKTIKVDAYKAEYDWLMESINGLIKDMTFPREAPPKENALSESEVLVI